MTTKEKFIEMAKNITRPGIDEMMAWLETTDFYVAPASTKFHGAQAGGLCAHSITVAKRLVELANFYAPGKYSMDVLMTVALFHDVCKISTYQVEMRNRKNSVGAWEQVPFYQVCTEGERGRRQSRFSFLPTYHGAWYPSHAGGVRRCEQPHGRHESCQCERCLAVL